MRKLLLFVAALLCAGLLVAQTREEVEARIAKMPPDQRAYERFRYWVTMLPVNEQRDPNLDAKYRAYLGSQGFAAAEIDAQMKLVDERGAAMEIERWNQILTAQTPRFNTKPNAFLVEIVKNRQPGTALDVGMGQGRNAIWLAQQGWTATGFDPADRAVALANSDRGKTRSSADDPNYE
jgi:hypothetical protein